LFDGHVNEIRIAISSRRVWYEIL